MSTDFRLIMLTPDQPLIRPPATFSPDLGGEGTCGTLIWKDLILDRAKHRSSPVKFYWSQFDRQIGC